MIRLFVSIGLAFALGLGCGSDTTGPGMTPPSAPAVDMADTYCHPCCLPGTPNCGLACEDCLEATCSPRAGLPAGGGCCTVNRDPPDGGELCPRM